MSHTTEHINTLLFDLDGTLLDSRKFLVNTSFEVLETFYPGRFTVDDIVEEFGNGFVRLLPDKESETSQRAREKYHAIKTEKYHLTPLFPGVLEGLRTLREQGLKLGLVTNQNKELSIEALRENRIFDFFDVIIAPSDVREAKPSPEGILKAMQQLGCRKQEVAMIGDSRYDIMAGERAGVFTGFLNWYEDTVMPKAHSPDFTYKNFEQLVRTHTKTDGPNEGST